jgi:hypothetical protein
MIYRRELGDGMKKCNKCCFIKDNDEFHKSKNSKSGLHAYCIECNKKYKLENAEKIRIHRQKKHAENKEKNNSRCRIYHATPAGRARDLYKSAMKRAKMGGLEFSIIYEHVFVMLLHGKCQKSGIPFDLTQQKNKKAIYIVIIIVF